jgi:hypothetical protein
MVERRMLEQIDHASGLLPGRRPTPDPQSYPDGSMAERVHRLRRRHAGKQLARSTCAAYGAIAFTKLKPLGVPTPVTLSQPGPVVSDVSVPKVITNQRVENGLLYRAL